MMTRKIIVATKMKKKRAKRFLYKKDDNLRTERPSTLTGNDVIQNNRIDNVFNERRLDDMLNNIWSVRKDVRINDANAAQIGTKSFYSRHGEVSAPDLTSREPSARTKRAQKFNNAYHRSTGLGNYTPAIPKLSELHNNKKWKR